MIFLILKLTTEKQLAYQCSLPCPKMNKTTLLKRSKHSVMNKTTSKLALGSANFGLDYGLANNFGKISENELAEILSAADGAGVEIIDTAQAYGDSEARLGAWCDDYSFKIVTKIGVDLEYDCLGNNIRGLVEQSCKRLNQKRLYAVLLHRPEVLLGNKGSAIIRELQSLKDLNIVSKIGISIYSPDILGEISNLFQFDIVQAPFNIIDQQLLLSGWSDKLKESGVEIHTRSVFLQGLLLMQKPSLPKYFNDNWPDLFRSWYRFLSNNRADALNIALQFVLSQGWIDKIVVGVDSVSQLRALVDIEKSSLSLDFPLIRCDNPKLINPSKWNL